MKTRSIHPVTTVALVTLTCVITLGAATQAAPGMILLASRQATCLGGESDGGSVARWLANLTSAAKRLHGQNAAMASSTSRADAFDFARQNIPAPRTDASQPRPAVIASHLVDLPPPPPPL